MRSINFLQIVNLLHNIKSTFNKLKGLLKFNKRKPYKDSMNNIGMLLCGDSINDGIATEAFGQLSTTINSFATKCITFLNEDFSDETKSFGLFCSRVLLENSCAALVGRLDPFRVLYLSEFQVQPEYDFGKRAKSAFSWTGDVIADEKLGANGLWSLDNEVSKISRALFSKHSEHVYWKPAVEKMLDFVSKLSPDPVLADILDFDSESYINKNRGISLRLYSTLSKGVHWEIFSSQVLLDEVTIKSAIRDTLLLVSHLGLTSHFIPTAYASLSPDKAVEEYIKIRKLIV